MAQDDELFHELHDNPKVGGSQRAEWDDKTVCELEKLLTEHLYAHFKHAIKLIVGSGYKEQDAETIILRSRLFHGKGDILSSILTSALVSVDIEKEPHVTGYHVFENLESLVKYTLLEMICALREVKPSLTVLEAMWLIFIWDFNISNACTKEVGCYGPYCQAMTVEKYTELTNVSTPRKSESISFPGPKSAWRHVVTGGQSTGLTDGPAPELSKGQHVIGEEVQDLCQRLVGEKNTGCTGKSLSAIYKNEMHYCQKEFLLEKSCKVRTSKVTFKAKFLPLKSVSGTSGVAMKKSCSKSSKSSGSVTENIHRHKTDSTLNLSIADTPIIVKDTNFDNPTSSAIPSYYTGIPYDTTLKKHIPQDGKDEAILELALCLQKLQRSLQGWTDWANKKVKQGMIRVQEVKVDMITVKKVTEEVEKSCTNHLTTRHVELEKASARVVACVDSIDSTLSQLETENPTLSLEMKSAQLKALECSRDLEKVLQQEQIVLKNSQSIDQDRRMLQQELFSLKRNEADLLRKVEKAKVCLKQFEGQWRNENMEKLKSLSEAEAFRGRSVRLETLGKAKENAMRERSRCEIQKCRENIEKLEAEISLLKSETLQTRTRDEKRERECVVCLAEERSVLFLPCAHQVVCTQCNMKHEKEMDKCPSCRTLIRRRIQVQFHTFD